MYVSKNLVVALLFVTAGVFGWLSFAFMDQQNDEKTVAVATQGSQVVPMAAAPEGATTEQDPPPAAAAPQADGSTPGSNTRPVSADGNTNVYLTIVNSPASNQSGGTQAAATATAVAKVTNAPSGTSVSSNAAASSGKGGSAGQARQVAAAGVPQVSINGNHIVIASDGSVVLVGDDGRLIANTGDASASATVALANQGSEIGTGSSTVVAEGSDPEQAQGSVQGITGTTQVNTAVAPANGGSTHANGSLDSMLGGTTGTFGSVAVAGFEDHSVSVLGDDHLITYDDSNVFVSRDGQINANTGDTDSSGLNVVDAIDSVVRSGNSGDGEGNDDEEEEDEEEDTPIPGDGTIPDPDDDAVDDPDEDESDEDPDQIDAGARQVLSPAAATGPASASVDDEDVTTSATGPSAFVIGADGYDDVSIRVAGNRDIVTYDDSNVVIGGMGNVNAQIGDSDTAGAVVMGVRNSFIQAGCEGDLCYSK